MKMSKKKLRGKNFSNTEDIILVDLVEAQNQILQSKKKGTLTWRLKRVTWEQTAVKFATRSGVERPWTTLRDRYDTLQRQSRIEYVTLNQDPQNIATTSTFSVKENGGIIQVSAFAIPNVHDNNPKSAVASNESGKLDAKLTRSRGKNFSREEEYVLIHLVEAHIDILESKTSDVATWTQKRDAWKRLAVYFATQSGVNRPWTALKGKYENLKKKSLSELATNKDEKFIISEKIRALIQYAANEDEDEYDDDTSNQSMNESNIYKDNSEDSLQKENIQDSEEPAESECALARGNSKLHTEKKSPKHSFGKRKRNSENENLILTKWQQVYYRDENNRAAEKHQFDMEN